MAGLSFDPSGIKNIVKMALEDPDEGADWKAMIQNVNGFTQSTEIFKLVINQIRLQDQKLEAIKKELADTQHLLAGMAENMNIMATIFTQACSPAQGTPGLSTDMAATASTPPT